MNLSSEDSTQTRLIYFSNIAIGGNLDLVPATNTSLPCQSWSILFLDISIDMNSSLMYYP